MGTRDCETSSRWKGSVQRLVVLAAVLFFAANGTTLGQLTNSKHDLSSGSTAAIKATDTDELCIFCHIPHNGSPASRRPLWNHAPTASTLTWGGTTSRGTTLPTDTTVAALAGSNACLSCHDGTVALGDVLTSTDFTVAGTNVTSGMLSGGPAYLDPTDFAANHPIGVARPADQAGFTSFKASPTNDAAGVDYDANGNVQCQSCHNPHLTTVTPFLRKANTGSAICLTCHNL